MRKKKHEMILGKLEKELCFNSGFYTFLNPYSYLRLINSDADISKIDAIYVDGILMVIFLRVFNGVKVDRLSFDMTSIAPNIFDYCIENNKSISFVGASESEIAKFKINIESQYPRLNVVRFDNGFQNVLSESFIDGLISQEPDVIVAGLGTPLQEEFLIKLSQTKWRGMAFSCGGFIRQYSRDVQFFPNWSNKLHLRWLVRLFREPHVISRIFKYYPLFVYRYLINNR